MTEPRKSDPRSAQALLDVVPLAMRVIRQELRSHAGVSELTVPQFRTLVQCVRRNRTNGELAEALGVSRSAMSRMVDVLVDKGLLVRHPSSVDSRSVDIGLTDTGRAAYEVMRSKALACFAGILQELPEETSAALAGGLEALRRFVDAYESEKKSGGE